MRGWVGGWYVCVWGGFGVSSYWLFVDDWYVVGLMGR